MKKTAVSFVLVFVCSIFISIVSIEASQDYKFSFMGITLSDNHKTLVQKLKNKNYSVTEFINNICFDLTTKKEWFPCILLTGSELEPFFLEDHPIIKENDILITKNGLIKKDFGIKMIRAYNHENPFGQLVKICFSKTFDKILYMSIYPDSRDNKEKIFKELYKILESKYSKPDVYQYKEYITDNTWKSDIEFLSMMRRDDNENPGLVLTIMNLDFWNKLTDLFLDIKDNNEKIKNESF